MRDIIDATSLTNDDAEELVSYLDTILRTLAESQQWAEPDPS